MAQSMTMYQGEDWSQPFVFYADDAHTSVVVFTHPWCDVRGTGSSGALYATFTEDGSNLGTATITDDGHVTFSMSHEDTAKIPAGTYPIDIFADHATEGRIVLSKSGALQLVVQARVSQDQL